MLTHLAKNSPTTGLKVCILVCIISYVCTVSDLRIVTLLALAVVAVYNSLCSRVLKSSKCINDGVPRVKWLPIRVPIVDGLIFVYKLRTVGVELMHQLSEKYGPTFKAEMGLGSLLITTDIKYIQAILSSTSEDHLNKPEYFYNTLLTAAMKDGLVGAPYTTWIKHRQTLSSAFSYRSFIPYLKFMNDSAQKFIEQVANHQDANGVIQNKAMQAELDSTPLTITSQIILGSENLNMTKTEQKQFHQDFTTNGKDSSVERFMNPEQMIPFVWAIHPNKRKLDTALANMTQHVHKLIFRYIARDFAQANENQDITNFSLDAPTDSEHFESLKRTEAMSRMTDSDNGCKPYECLLEKLINASVCNKEICDEVTTFMAAGHETITTALDMLLFHLACNREAQIRCQQEVDSFLMQHYATTQQTASLTMEDLGQLKYLERCVLESMRLTPTVPMILRWLENPLQVSKDSYLAGSETMCLYFWGVHRNPEFYPNPDKFNPDRFLSEAVKARPSHTFLPFSLGSRNCIGWKLALLEMKLILAKVVSNFDFWTTDTPEDVNLLFHITLKPERTYNICFKKRLRTSESG